MSQVSKRSLLKLAAVGIVLTGAMLSGCSKKEEPPKPAAAPAAAPTAAAPAPAKKTKSGFGPPLTTLKKES